MHACFSCSRACVLLCWRACFCAGMRASTLAIVLPCWRARSYAGVRALMLACVLLRLTCVLLTLPLFIRFLRWHRSSLFSISERGWAHVCSQAQLMPRAASFTTCPALAEDVRGKSNLQLRRPQPLRLQTRSPLLRGLMRVPALAAFAACQRPERCDSSWRSELE